MRSMKRCTSSRARSLLPTGAGQLAALGPATWHSSRRAIPNEVRKLAVCRHGMPRPFGHVLRAWNKAVDILTGFPRASPSRATVPLRRPGHASLPRSGAVVDKPAASRLSNR
jgi:hypothetical protein